MHDSALDRLRRDVISTVETVNADFEYVLAGSYALQQHGVLSRETHDVDMFLEQSLGLSLVGAFDDLILRPTVEALESIDIAVEVTLHHETSVFARLKLERDGTYLECDLGIDKRLEPPVELEIGRALSLKDAIDSKLAAFVGRGAPRDFYDAWKIIIGEGLDVKAVLSRASEREVMADSLADSMTTWHNALNVRESDLREYGVSSDEFAEMHAFYEKFLAECDRLLEEGVM